MPDENAAQVAQNAHVEHVGPAMMMVDRTV
jgi:hypothetical protein